jgi:hypothetical protein
MSSASEEESLHGEDDHEEETKAGTVTAAVLRPSQLIDATELEGGAAAAVAAGTAAASSAPPSPKISDKAAKVPPAKATRRPTKSRRKQKASNMPSRPLSGEIIRLPFEDANYSISPFVALCTINLTLQITFPFQLSTFSCAKRRTTGLRRIDQRTIHRRGHCSLQ